MTGSGAADALAAARQEAGGGPTLPLEHQPDASPGHFAVSDLTAEERKELYNRFGLLERGYTMGVVGYSINIFLLARYPQYYWLWHLTKAFIYLPWRFIRFRRKNWELYMLDFCYLNTYMTVLGCALAFIRITAGIENPLHRYNYELLRGGFAFANGALLWAVILFNNKLVFHDTDNTASLYIHMSPPLLFWTLRWGGGFGTTLIEKTWPNMFDICRDMTEGDGALASFRQMLWYSGPCEGLWREFITYPAVIFVIFWGVPYFLIVFCCLKGWIERNGKATLYKDTVADKKGKGMFLNMLPESLRPIGFMCQHFLFTVTMGFVSIAMWNSFILHTGFLLAIMLFAVHNGSSFMFKVVAAKYVQRWVDNVASPKHKPMASPRSTANEDAVGSHDPLVKAGP